MTRINVFFVVTVCVFAVSTFAIVQYFRTARGHTAVLPYDLKERRSLRIGDTVCLPHTSGPPRPALLFVLSRTCPYSQAMIPVAQMAQDYANESAVEIIIVVDSLKALDDDWSRVLRSPSVRVFVGSRVDVGYSATPVIALLDKDRRIKAHKIGFSASDDGAEVLVNIRDAKSPYSAEINDISRSRLESDASLVDAIPIVTLQRNISSDSLSVPTITAFGTIMTVADLTLRAPYELDDSQPLILDCGDVTGYDCEVSARSLVSLGYTLMHTIDGWEGKTLVNSCLE